MTGNSRIFLQIIGWDPCPSGKMQRNAQPSRRHKWIHMDRYLDASRAGRTPPLRGFLARKGEIRQYLPPCCGRSRHQAVDEPAPGNGRGGSKDGRIRASVGDQITNTGIPPSNHAHSSSASAGWSMSGHTPPFAQAVPLGRLGPQLGTPHHNLETRFTPHHNLETRFFKKLIFGSEQLEV